MPINVTDFDNMIRGFMINTITKKYPSLDTSPNSGFDDYFTKPMISIFRPVVENVNKLELLMNLGKADYMTEEELDTIGESNYLITRNPGQQALTTLTLSFTNISETQNLVIPAGLLFQTDSGLTYETTERVELTPPELYTMYNPSKMAYDVDILIRAIDVGIEYNVAENQIVKPVVKFNPNLLSVTNKAPVTSGIDKESNASYAERMRSTYMSHHIGTSPGYIQHIYDAFNEVQDVYVAGYKDPFMTRDTINIIDPITSEIRQVVDTHGNALHIGGKVDVYIKGCIYETEETIISLNSNYLILGQKTGLIDLTSITATNITDGSKSVLIADKLDVDGKCVIKLENTSDRSFDSTIVSKIAIAYKYTDDAVTHNQIDTFNVGITKSELSCPFKDIISLQNSDDTQFYNHTNYTIEQVGDIGTSTEDTYITLIGLDNVPNGTPIIIKYSVNSTLKNLRDMFEDAENRIVTTDIVIREANPIFVNLAFKIKMKDSYVFDDIKRSYIDGCLNDFFAQCQLGAEVQESDIIGWIYRDDNVMTFIDYIVLPFTSFYVTDTPSAPIESIRDDTYLAVNAISYPVLNKAIITAI
jgi:hypothetical protein